MDRVISKLGEKSRNLRGYPRHDSFTLLSFFVGWVGGFLKTASALGCGILHLDPKDVSFEWMKLDISISYLQTIVDILIELFPCGGEPYSCTRSSQLFEPLVIARLVFLCNLAESIIPPD